MSRRTVFFGLGSETTPPFLCLGNFNGKLTPFSFVIFEHLNKLINLAALQRKLLLLLSILRYQVLAVIISFYLEHFATYKTGQRT